MVNHNTKTASKEIHVSETPLVSVMCATFNQKDYIGDAIESFLMQKTSFPFEILINDDCSTDGTTQICLDYQRKYPDKIRVITHDENQWQYGAKVWSEFLMPEARGKYMAMCEGDDFWTDPLKLQKQFDVMEANPGYTSCVHATASVNAATKKRLTLMHFYDESRRVDFADVAKTVQCFAFNSHFIRMDAMWDYVRSDLAQLPDDADHMMVLYFCTHNDGMYYIADEMSAYRLFAKGSINRTMMDSEDYRQQVQTKHDERVQTLEFVDKMTDGRLHGEIIAGIDGMDFALYKDLRDYRTLKRRWPDRLTKESFPSRVNLFLYTYAKPLHKLAYSVYCKL